eukprot:TRINITY_DN2924_c0_g1_i1.p1 TRINITY_DN2924_c0_g1~~TRINITY_DN2924_c0_g1_i1.p1  ORF type:complete len:343 (+),score=108.96 TRINITY_DN2924_c0_g1_i1:262-1290(+)
MAPKAITCYICGQGYFASSIGIHLKNCKKLFIEREMLKPKNERKALPEVPSLFVQLGIGIDDDEPTAVTKRRVPQKKKPQPVLQIPEEDVGLMETQPRTKGRPKTAAQKAAGLANISSAQLAAYNKQANKTMEEATFVRCANCNRTFLPERLIAHNKSCTPENPFRRVGDVKAGFAPGVTKSELDEKSKEFISTIKRPQTASLRSRVANQQPAKLKSLTSPSKSPAKSPARLKVPQQPSEGSHRPGSARVIDMANAQRSSPGLANISIEDLSTPSASVSASGSTSLPKQVQNLQISNGSLKLDPLKLAEILDKRIVKIETYMRQTAQEVSELKNLVEFLRKG